MRQSKLFGKTRRDFPKDETSVNARLLIRAGFVEKAAAGIYSFLPLGLRVFKKIENIIRDEMNQAGCQEILMPVLMSRELWEKTGRWTGFGEALFKLKDKSDREWVLGPTHEELVSELAKSNISTYRDLPLAVFQIQEKFRDEPRAKAGLMRGREFFMKDMYSFHANEQDLNSFYDELKKVYLKVYSRCGLRAFSVEASGGTFTTQFSHEFMVKSEAGEDVTILCELCGWAQNREISKKSGKDHCPNCGGLLKEEKTVEAGNIFKLGTKFSENLDVTFADKDGHHKPAIMGCFGIGLSRLVGTIVEVFHDEDGIMWPLSVAPYAVHLLRLENANQKTSLKISKAADKLYESLKKKEVEVLYDDRSDKTAGEKFADADLIGIPFRILISEKTLSNNEAEFKDRASGKIQMIKLTDVAKFISEKISKK